MWVVIATASAGVAAYLLFPLMRPPKIQRKFLSARLPKLSDDQLLHFALAFRLELESGVLCEAALEHALDTLPRHAMTKTRNAISSRTSISEAMHEDAQAFSALKDLSLAIVLSQKQGSQLGGALSVMTDAIQNRIETDQLLRSELASVRATILVLASLPIFGIGFASALGAHPLAWLLGTSPGRVCVLVSALLEVLGLLWTRLLVNRAVRSQS